MKKAASLMLVLLLLLTTVNAQDADELAAIWEREHITNIFPSNLRHAQLKKYIDDLKRQGVKIEEAGRSYYNREIYQMEFGAGPMRVFLWSQMHGDEPTATSALIDIFSILHRNRDKAWVKQIAEKMTIRAVPMLNPDGAELFVRRNPQGIDINRDAIDLKTPEGRLLKKLRDEWSPEIGFNLHNQNELTAAGYSNKQAAISLLVVLGDEEKTITEGHERNRRLASLMNAALQKFIPGHVGRYSDEWTPTAFGDNFSAWGTPTILIETGALHGKDEMFLVKMNFVAILTALRALADGSERSVSPANYDLIPENVTGRLYHVIFRNASVIDRSDPSIATPADIGVNLARRRSEFVSPGIVRQLGTLSNAHGLDEYDASDFLVTGRFQPLTRGNFGELLFYRKGRNVNWAAADLEKEVPPDAIFSLGKWLRGEGVVPKK